MAKETEIDEIDELQLKEEIVNDYKIACLSREMSLLGRREVLTGKAKFGIFGDGKEIAQIALAKQFQNGDFRSGYYRDQTFMMAAGLLKPQEFFAQLYAHADVDAEPASAGRQMNGHYATRSLNPDGTWRNLMEQKNSSADISPTASQMPRLLGLAYASRFYRNNPELKDHTNFSNKGNEIAFGTIGDASTSEGLFWESINAAGVLGVPMVISVWDDGHGISVSKKYQTTKESISEILQGFEKIDERGGYKIIRAKGWDYGQLVLAYEEAAEIARTTHTPVLVHVEEMTQPQGHSTSGSHERYKSAERLAWETEFDPITKFGEWMIDKGFASQEDLNGFQEAAKKEVRTQKAEAWKAFMLSMKAELSEMLEMLEALAAEHSKSDDIRAIAKDLSSEMDPMRKEIVSAARRSLRLVRSEESSAKNTLLNWLTASKAANEERYSSHLHSESELSALNVNAVAPVLDEEKLVDGREVIRDNFDALLAKHPELIIFGEDSGKIGGVNQGLEGLQEKYGEHRVFDTGIREATIIGQGIGMAMRGLRPVAEIQYLDYLLYALQVMSDDWLTVQYRTKGGQKAPLIIRTRGHRLEGVWHSGSPMGMIVNAARGIHVCVPRNMVQAAGMYNTLLASDEPGLVIESLNGYRLKENQPANLGEYTVALGQPEVIHEGTDITLVTYGSMVRMVSQVAEQLKAYDISAEVIDVQTLLPFDLNHSIVESLKKTSRVVFIDEDVPGGGTAYMMQKVLDEQGGYFHLDSNPKCLSSKEHRPAYGSDGDYFSKPSLEDIFDAAYEIMHEADPKKYPRIY